MTTPTMQRTALQAALHNLQYELVPVPTIGEAARHLPDGARITITASPKMGIDRTIEAAEELARDGYTVVPHLTARQIRSPEHLSEIIDRLTTVGINKIMALAGDAHSPAGPFTSSLELLRALTERGRPFTDIGISGYPEGHPFIPAVDLKLALQEKAGHATYIVTQMCFSAAPIQRWLSDVRGLGIKLPVYIGIPGRVSQKRLLAVATQVGVGTSLQFLKRNLRSVLRLFLSSQYDPGDLVRELQPCFSKPGGAAGFHVYTFNAASATESWRQEFMRQL